MGTRMEDKDLAAHSDGAFQLQGEEIHSQCIGIRVYRIAQINDIRGVDNKVLYPVFRHIIPGGIDIQFSNRLPFGILGGAGVDHKGIGSIGNRFFGRAKQHVPAGHFNVRTYFHK